MLHHSKKQFYTVEKREWDLITQKYFARKSVKIDLNQFRYYKQITYKSDDNSIEVILKKEREYTHLIKIWFFLLD